MSALAPPALGDPFGGASALAPSRSVGGLWKRLIAFVADAVLVGIAATILALPFFDVLSRLGAWGRLIGFCLAFPYFAILNSALGHGQTLGKRWMHLQVVNQSGNPVSFRKASMRYAVFAIPYYLDDLVLPVTRTPRIISYLLSPIVALVVCTTLYLVLFNRRTRQGVHDLAAETYVADADVDGAMRVQPIWRMHWLILGLLFAVTAAGGLDRGKETGKMGTLSAVA